MDFEQFAIDIVKAAVKAGADEADAYIQTGRESEVSSRMEKVETIKESISQGYGIRVFKNKQVGFCHSCDFGLGAMRHMVEKAISLAQESSADQFNGLPESNKPVDLPELDLYDKAMAKISAQWKIDTCIEAERAMFEYDKRVINSGGAGFNDGEETTYIADSNGAINSFKSSHCYLMVNPIAKENDKMESGYWYSFKKYFSDLDNPIEVARIAAERTIRMLGARIVKTSSVPVVFDNITGAYLLGLLAEAIDGEAVFKNATFLAGKLDDQIASPLVTIIDDGLMPRGLASAPFDGDGLLTRKKEIISNGTLRTYLYDTYTARKAKTESTANAHRQYASPPSIGPFNLYLQAGNHPFDEIINSTKEGLLVTNLMGFGANNVTGDYSLGGSGIWIENGELSYPVEGITVAANMFDILKRIDMIGNDLRFMGSVSSPTFRIAEMTVSGQ